MKKMLQKGDGRLNVCLQWECVGSDLLILLTGGERPHIGASVIAWNTENGVRSHAMPVPGHKELELAVSCAERCCHVWGHTVQVSCGIHIDMAQKEEIVELVRMASDLTERFLEEISKETAGAN